MFQLKCKVAPCVFKGTKERRGGGGGGGGEGETMAKGAMNKNLSKAIKLSAQGEARNLGATKMMQPDNKELSSHHAPFGRTREARHLGV